jgi:hypothetical protein
MKTLKYTRHAKNRMRLHEINEADVELAIDNPDLTEPSFEERKNVWKKISDRYLRVTYREEKDRILIITAVKKKKGWRL